MNREEENFLKLRWAHFLLDVQDQLDQVGGDGAGILGQWIDKQETFDMLDILFRNGLTIKVK